MTELRVWSYLRDWDELAQYSRTTLTDYRLPLLVSYWRLSPLNDHFQLEDSSLNLQYTPKHPNGPFTFIYDETLPV